MLINGNALQIPLADNTVHCVVTSPPYWGLRDYGTARWEGGDPECDHKIDRTGGIGSSTLGGGKSTVNHQQEASYRDICGKCGAVRIDNQLGLEPTPDAYVANMVAVFREVWRVLRTDGVVFLNLGDSYQDKQLVGTPWRVALALKDDGWILRSDIIWAKMNPMPESVTDRPTRSHEYLFLLTKAARYFWDAEAVKEPNVSPGQLAHNLKYAREYDAYDARASATGQPGNVNNKGIHSRPGGIGRNLRTVWTIATQPYREAHFATFPPALVEPCIKASTSERGVCPVCGKPWVRVVERTAKNHISRVDRQVATGGAISGGVGKNFPEVSTTTTGWRPTCDHDAEPVPALVLDPFCGSGTVGEVCRGLRRRFVGVDLSAEYLARNAMPRAELKTCQAAIAELPMFAEMGGVR